MNDYKLLSDEKLLNLLRESDHDAYTEIYNRYFYLMYTHAYKKLRDEEQAKDLIHELFAGLWFKRELFKINTNLSGYLFTAVRNKVFDMFAHQQVKDNYTQAAAHFLDNVSGTPADYLIREKQLKEYIEKAIKALPPKMRMIFEMSRKQHLSYKEIAEQTSTSENNVSKQILSALGRLKIKLGIVSVICLLVQLKS